MSGEPMLLLLGLLLLCDSVAPCPLVDVTVCDNPYCIGFRTGATFSEMIHSRLAASKQLPGWRAFYATEHGKAVVQALAETNCAMYERRVAESKALVLLCDTLGCVTNKPKRGLPLKRGSPEPASLSWGTLFSAREKGAAPTRPAGGQHISNTCSCRADV